MSSSSRSERVGFLIVGTPRSGTTLVQRLACEIPGVRMPPETHFFTEVVPSLLSRRSFPLRGDELADEIDRLASFEQERGVDVDPRVIASALGGSSGCAFDLFDALVRHLAGPAQVWGEKTPDHLLWWRPISSSAPWVRFVLVVRDPRAVVASLLDLPWSDGAWINDEDPGSAPRPWNLPAHLRLAQQWASQERVAAAMVEELGSERCLLVRYEDTVSDPDRTRSMIADFLGLGANGSEPEPDSACGFVLPGEPWKLRALGPVDSGRATAWRRRLGGPRGRDVAIVCREGMRRLGYGIPRMRPLAAAATAVLSRRYGADVVAQRSQLGRDTYIELAGFRAKYDRWLRSIDETKL